MPQRRRPQIEVPQHGRVCDEVHQSASPKFSPRTVSLQARSIHDIILPIGQNIEDTVYDVLSRRAYPKDGLDDGRRERTLSEECTYHNHGNDDAFISPISLEGFRPRLAGRRTVSAREFKVDGHVLGEDDFDYWARRIEDDGGDSDGEFDGVDESDLERQRSLALHHLGETVLVRCNRSKWHSGKITKIGDEGVRLWVELARSTLYVPFPLISTHLRRVSSPAPSQPQLGRHSSSSTSLSAGVIYTGVCMSPSGSSGSSGPITPVIITIPDSFIGTARLFALKATAPTVVKSPVHAVRPSHLSHRLLYRHVAVHGDCSVCSNPLHCNSILLSWACGHQAHFSCARPTHPGEAMHCPLCPDVPLNKPSLDATFLCLCGAACLLSSLEPDPSLTSHCCPSCFTDPWSFERSPGETGDRSAPTSQDSSPRSPASHLERSSSGNFSEGGVQDAATYATAPKRGAGVGVGIGVGMGVGKGEGVGVGAGEGGKLQPVGQRRGKRAFSRRKKDVEFEEYYDYRSPFPIPSHTSPKNISPPGKSRFNEPENEEGGASGYERRKSEELTRGEEGRGRVFRRRKSKELSRLEEVQAMGEEMSALPVANKGGRLTMPRSQSASSPPIHNLNDGPNADVISGPGSPLRLNTRMAPISEYTSPERNCGSAHPSFPPLPRSAFSASDNTSGPRNTVEAETQPKDPSPIYRKTPLTKAVSTDKPPSPKLVLRTNAALEASRQLRRSASMGTEELNGAVLTRRRRSMSGCQVSSQPEDQEIATEVPLEVLGASQSQAMEPVASRLGASGSTSLASSPSRVSLAGCARSPGRTVTDLASSANASTQGSVVGSPTPATSAAPFPDWASGGNWISVVKGGQDTRPKDPKLEKIAAFKEGMLGKEKPPEGSNIKGVNQWVTSLKA